MPNERDNYDGLPVDGTRYAHALLATWREAIQKSGNLDMVSFTKEDIVRHGQNLLNHGVKSAKLDVKNVPDIIYTFRARAELPAEILSHGHYAIIGRGKGKYAFARISRPNRFSPHKATKVETVKNSVPPWVRPYMGNDEQGMLTKTACNDLVKRHLNLRQAFRLQSHLRMGVLNYGQVEVDEVYAGECADGSHVIIAVEAKDPGDNDLLNVSQLFGTSKALQSKFEGVQKRLLGLKPNEEGNISICEFTVTPNVAELTEKGDWVTYVFT